MSELFLTHRIGKQRHVCISELSAETLTEHGLTGPAFRGGMYLYTLDDRPRVGGISVLARVPTEDAAFELLDLLKVSRRRKKETSKKSPRKTSQAKSKRVKKTHKPVSRGKARL